ncbi:MAG: alpha/beta hydrolase [Candidatus Hydrogenedentes bacterium]|nr:alpha/beta hydrolase [Candidatus Hydrogenedentota bacterium]
MVKKSEVVPHAMGTATLFVLLVFIDNGHAESNANVVVTKDVQYGVGLIENGASRQPLFLDIYRVGQGAELKPTLILIHGGGFSGGDKSNYEKVARQFAAQGFVCFSINYRLTGNKPPNGIASTFEDAKTAVRWIRAHQTKYGVDPKRIAAMGSSAGASIADTLALSEASEYRPDLDVPENNPSVDSSIQACIDHSGGCAASGTADSEDPPILIMHAIGDSKSPFSCAEHLRDRITKAGGTCRFLALPGSDHVPPLETTFNGKTLFDHVLAFLNEHLIASIPPGG